MALADIKPSMDTYNTEFKRNLIEDIKSECSGHFEDVLVGEPQRQSGSRGKQPTPGAQPC
jgi:hypothetical protein